MKARLSLIAAGLAAALPAPAQVAFEGDYSQDFNSLASSTAGNPYTWTDNSTLPGWYAASSLAGVTSYAVSTGSTTAGSVYSFGSVGSSDRALGAIPVNGTVGSPGPTAAYAFGVRLQNTAGVTLENFTVSFTGEQWRNSANTAQSLTFWYQVGVNLTSLTPASDAGWTSVTALNFVSPNTGGSAGTLNGNLAANHQDFSSTLNGISLLPGQELLLRWKDINDSGNDHGLAIDSFNVTALAVVPEPSTWALLGGGLLFLAHRLRRRK